MSQDWRDLFGTIDVSTSGLQGNGIRKVTSPPAPPKPAPIAAQPVTAQQIVAPAAVAPVQTAASVPSAPAKQPPANQAANQAAYPSYWTMAQTVTASAVQFAASGGKTVSREVREERLSICKMCPQFDGTRCIQCGCFIAAKTWVPHEKCPAGKWPN
jgi:Family of unknown function (DUF6171)